MVLPGETIWTGAPEICTDCGVTVKLQVLKSPAGYYVGTMCHCGPYSRESGYYHTREEAEKALKDDSFYRA